MRQVTYRRERWAAVRELMPKDSLRQTEVEMTREVYRLVLQPGHVFVRDSYKKTYDIVLRMVEVEVLPGIMEDVLTDLRRVEMTGEAWMDVLPEHREAMSKVKTDHQTWSMPIIETIAERVLLP